MIFNGNLNEVPRLQQINREKEAGMKRLIFPVLFCALLFLFWNDLCRSQSPQQDISRDEVLAVVKDETITVGRFLDYLQMQKITSINPEEDQRRKEDELQKLIREIRIDQRAASLNLESDSLFVRRRDNNMRDFILSYMYQKDVSDRVEVTDQEVKDYYQSHLEEDFLIPEEVQVRDLLIRVQADPDQKDYHKRLKKAEKEAKEKIEEFHQRIKAGEDFTDLCREHTQAGIPQNAGNLGFIKRGQISSEFDAVAFLLKEKGEISEPVKDYQGYHLIQLLDKKEKSYQKLDSTLFEGIREYLRDEEIRRATWDFIDSLKNEAGFVYNMEILSEDESSPDENEWVVSFGEEDTIRWGQYERALGRLKFNLRRDNLTLEEKKSLLSDQLALPIILEKEARKRGYAGSVEYQAEERAFTMGEARRRVIAERVKEDFPPPSMEEMQAYYQAHKIDFPPLGVPVHVYHIVFDDSQEAVQVSDQIKQGADFVETAKKYFPGEPEIKDIAYDLGFITQGEMPDEFYSAALELKEGEVSQPVKTQWGFHIIKMVERKEGGTTFTDIIPKIQGAINLDKGRKHLAEWEKNLIEQANVEIDRKLLRELKLPKPEG
jgi:peptidyl-prolyl cis-trans isomerase C